MDTIRNINPYALYVHCDGAMDYDSKNSGGIGIEIKFPDTIDLDPIKITRGRYVGANIERLELEAIIRGMIEVSELFESYRNDKLKNINTIIITTDRYNLNDNEKTSPFKIRDWRKNNWYNFEGKAIKNSDLLDRLDKLRKKLNDKTFCRINIIYQRRKFNRGVDKLAKDGKKKALKNDSIAIMGIKIGKRKFDGDEIDYHLLKEKENHVVNIFKKEPVRDQWEIDCEFCDGNFLGKKLKIYTAPETEKKLHRSHIYSVRLKNIFQHHVTIYKTIRENKNEKANNHHKQDLQSDYSEKKLQTQTLIN